MSCAISRANQRAAPKSLLLLARAMQVLASRIEVAALTRLLRQLAVIVRDRGRLLGRRRARSAIV